MIPVNEPLFISDEKKYLSKCIDSGWISSEGPFVKEFEKKFSLYIGKKEGIVVSSGTAALEIAIGATGLNPGDEIIMPTFTIISCLSAAITYGVKPVFVDADPKTWNMDVTKIEEKITEKTKAIMVVHIYGHPCDMNPILKIAKKYKLLIIEDAAEAHGAEYNNKKCGSFGDISCFSFYANKVINTGEGGMVLTDNKKFAERTKTLRNLGFIKKKRFYHKEFARNYRMTNLQAAIGVAQLKNINKLVKIKIENANKYTELLKDIPGLELPIEKNRAKNIYWMYGIVLAEKTGYKAWSFAKRLEKQGIQTRPFFYPLHLQPALKKSLKDKKEKFPISERIANQGLYLPSGLALKDWQIKKVCQVIKKTLRQKI
jgi:perosamine synthetase